MPHKIWADVFEGVLTGTSMLQLHHIGQYRSDIEVKKAQNLTSFFDFICMFLFLTLQCA